MHSDSVCAGRPAQAAIPGLANIDPPTELAYRFKQLPSTAAVQITPSCPPHKAASSLLSTMSAATSTAATQLAADKPSTSSHPPASAPDPTTNSHASQRGLSASATAGSSELASLKVNLKAALRQFPDFPEPGILFEDILPIFANAALHKQFLRALELHVSTNYAQKPDVIVGLDARGFLFGPSLALAIGASFVPVRKKGKLPGPTETASYKKEYGEDFFQIQADAVKPGQKVLIVDDIIATGKSYCVLR